MNEYVEKLHKYDYGYFSIEKDREKWETNFFNNTKDISISINLNENDVYMSQNTFTTKQRRIVYLNEIKALYIDIDCYKKNLSKEAVKYFLEKDLYGEIPVPNLLIDSGRGLYYIIFLEANANDLPKWQLMEEYLYSKMEYLGADKKALDVTRVLRVPQSVNSRNNNIVKIIDRYDYEYNLDELIENYIPEISIEKKKVEEKTPTKGRKKKFVSLYNLYNLYYTRYKDLLSLVKIRNYDVEGYRENILFLIRYFLTVYSDEEKALKEVLEINNSLKKPLSEKEVINATASAVVGAKEKKYKYSNDKLIKLLDITSLEQKQMSTIISKSEKYYRNNEKRKKNRRNEEGLTSRQLAKLNNINNIKKLRKENEKYSSKEIALKLKLSDRYVQKLIKEISN